MLTLCQEVTKTVTVNGKEYIIRILDDDAGFGAVCDDLKLTVWPTNNGQRRGMADAEEELIKLIVANV